MSPTLEALVTQPQTHQIPEQHTWKIDDIGFCFEKLVHHETDFQVHQLPESLIVGIFQQLHYRFYPPKGVNKILKFFKPPGAQIMILKHFVTTMSD